MPAVRSSSCDFSGKEKLLFKTCFSKIFKPSRREARSRRSFVEARRCGSRGAPAANDIVFARGQHEGPHHEWGPGYDDPVQAVTGEHHRRDIGKKEIAADPFLPDRVAAALLSVQRKRIYPSGHLSPFSPLVLCPTSKREARGERRERRCCRRCCIM